jgi:hypothetical protein
LFAFYGICGNAANYLEPSVTKRFSLHPSQEDFRRIGRGGIGDAALPCSVFHHPGNGKTLTVSPFEKVDISYSYIVYLSIHGAPLSDFAQRQA